MKYFLKKLLDHEILCSTVPFVTNFFEKFVKASVFSPPTYREKSSPYRKVKPFENQPGSRNHKIKKNFIKIFQQLSNQRRKVY